MALEGVIYQHDHIYNYTEKEAYSKIYRENEASFYDLQASLNYFDNQTQNYDSSSLLQEECYENTNSFFHQPLLESVTNEAKFITPDYCDMSYYQDSAINAMGTKKATRGRTRVKKNIEEINNQRMTHIAVERNRRRLMNEYLSILRSIMPDSHVQKCDQASIVGSAINFIRELEHRLHSVSFNGDISSATPFSDTFKHPQFSMAFSSVSKDVPEVNALADIEVSVVESHASLKIRSRKRPKLLLNLVSGLESLGFIILHLNVSTVSDFILYCFSTKMEDCCKLTSVSDIATSVYEIIRIHHCS